MPPFSFSFPCNLLVFDPPTFYLNRYWWWVRCLKAGLDDSSFLTFKLDRLVIDNIFNLYYFFPQTFLHKQFHLAVGTPPRKITKCHSSWQVPPGGLSPLEPHHYATVCWCGLTNHRLLWVMLYFDVFMDKTLHTLVICAALSILVVFNVFILPRLKCLAVFIFCWIFNLTVS